MIHPALPRGFKITLADLRFKTARILWTCFPPRPGHWFTGLGVEIFRWCSFVFCLGKKLPLEAGIPASVFTILGIRWEGEIWNTHSPPPTETIFAEAELLPQPQAERRLGSKGLWCCRWEAVATNILCQLCPAENPFVWTGCLNLPI